MPEEPGCLYAKVDWSSLDIEPPGKALKVLRLAAVNTACGPQRFFVTHPLSREGRFALLAHP